ncbi:hypothetical protein D3C73_1655680 [compost metagenome]
MIEGVHFAVLNAEAGCIHPYSTSIRKYWLHAVSGDWNTTSGFRINVFSLERAFAEAELSAICLKHDR